MTEQEYIGEIKKMILQGLTIEYSPTLPNKADLEKRAREALVPIIQSEELYNSVANAIKNWSYDQASKSQYTKTPEGAKQFLSLVKIRDLTVAYIQEWEKKKEKEKENRII